MRKHPSNFNLLVFGWRYLFDVHQTLVFVTGTCKILSAMRSRSLCLCSSERFEVKEVVK